MNMIRLNKMTESSKIRITRQFHSNNRVYNKGSEKAKYYYEIPGNKLNPHTYFYRVLAVPYLKFCGMFMITYYSLNGLWGYLESEANSAVEEKESGK